MLIGVLLLVLGGTGLFYSFVPFDMEGTLESVPGYIGWVGNVNRLDKSKAYISTMSGSYIEENHVTYASQFSLEALKIQPVGEKTMKNIFFDKQTSFSHHFNNKEFSLECYPVIGYTLLDLLNFIPSNKLQDLLPNEEAREQRFTKQQIGLYQFLASYRAYHGKSMCVTKDTMKPPIISYEQRDKHILLEKVMVFGPNICCVLEEVGVRVDVGIAPTGFIDIASCEYRKNEGIVNLVSIASYKDSESVTPCSNIIATSVKGEGTYTEPGSDRQVVIELLATSQVLCASEKDFKYVIALKATATKFQPYFYFPEKDLLLRVKGSITFEADMAANSDNELGDALMGCFIFYLLLRHAVNPALANKILEASQSTKCGWQASFKSSGVKYMPHLCLQKYPTRSSKRPYQTDQSECSEKKYKLDEFPDFPPFD